MKIAAIVFVIVFCVATYAFIKANNHAEIMRDSKEEK